MSQMIASQSVKKLQLNLDKKGDWVYILAMVIGGIITFINRKVRIFM